MLLAPVRTCSHGVQGTVFHSNATAMGMLSTRSRTDSASPTSGALLSRGGLGVAKNVHIGGRVVVEDSAAPRMVSAASGVLEPSPPALSVRGDADIVGTLKASGGLRVSHDSTTKTKNSKKTKKSGSSSSAGSDGSQATGGKPDDDAVLTVGGHSQLYGELRVAGDVLLTCLLYTSPSPRDRG